MSTIVRLFGAFAVLVLTCLPASGQALDALSRTDPVQTRASEPSKVRALDWILPAVFIGSTLAIHTPDECRWCDRDSLGRDSLNQFDRSARSSLRWNKTGTPDTMSWITEFGPVALLFSLNKEHLQETVLPVFQAFGTTYLVTSVVKVSAARERPAVHFGGTTSSDANASFFSGHSSGAFALVFALARVNSDRHDSRTKWIWIAGLPLASATGYMRMAADKHYMTDVLTGAAVGAAIGWWIPAVWSPTGDRGVSVAPSVAPGGANLSVRWRW